MDPIKVDPEIMGGTPCFAGTRVPISTLFDYLGHGDPLSEFLLDFPTVKPELVVRVIELARGSLLDPLAPVGRPHELAESRS